MKSKIAIVVILLVSIAMFSAGAFAYFNTGAPKAVTGNIKSGTLTMAIAGVSPSAACPTTGYGDATTLWDFQNIAPGDEITGKLCMINTGSLPIAQVTFNWKGMTELLAQNLFVTKLENSLTGDEAASYIAAYDANGDGKMSLSELNATGGVDEYWVGGEPVFLPVSTTPQWVNYTFVFNPDADNTLQNQSFNYNLDVVGYQKAQY